MTTRTTTSKADVALARTMGRECLAVRVRLLSRTLTRLYDEAARPYGLTTAQVGLLIVVTAEGPIQPARIADVLSMDKSTVSRDLERLKAKGWIALEPGEIGHTLLVRVTDAGARLLREVEPAWRQAQAAARALLSDQGAQELLELTDALWSRLIRP